VRRTQIRTGGHFTHRRSGRVAIVTSIMYPHTIEYRYVRPRRQRDPWDYPPIVTPYTRRTKMSYRRFILTFKKETRSP
jgi:hypothetical protein